VISPLDWAGPTARLVHICLIRLSSGSSGGESSLIGSGGSVFGIGTDIGGCGNFDIILVHLTRVFQPSATPLAPCDVLYLVSILIGW
jgi:hypothetical protein